MAAGVVDRLLGKSDWPCANVLTRVGSSCYWLLLMPFLAFPSTLAAQPSPAQVIEHLEEQLASLSRIHIAGNSLTSQTVEGAQPTIVETEEFDITLDLEKRMVQLNYSTTVYNLANSATESFQSKTNVCSSRKTDVSFDSEGNPEVVAVDDSVDQSEWEATLCSSTFGVVFGYLPWSDEYAYLPTLLKDSELTLNTATARDSSGAEIVERTCLELVGTSGDIVIKLKVDPDAGYLLSSLSIDRPKASIKPGEVSRITYEVTSRDRIGDTFVPTQFTVTSYKPGGKLVLDSPSYFVDLPKSRVLEAQTVERKFDFTVTEIVPQDRAGTAVLTELPDGLDAYFTDAPHLSYSWNGGDLEPRLSRNAEFLANSARFTTSGDSTTLKWLIIGNVVAFLVMLLWLIVRHRRRTFGSSHPE